MAAVPPSHPIAPVARRERRLDRAALVTYVALALTLALGLILRWWNLPYAEFQYDQAFSLGKAFDMVQRGAIPLAGIHSSVGSAQGPMEIYLLALPAAISQSPLVATAYVGLLQTLAVAGTYWLGSRYFGRGVGLVGAFLYAVNPWAVTYGRKIWTPSLMPFFTVLFLAALFAGTVERRRHGFTLACLFLTVLYLTHPQALVFAPLLAGLAVLQWRRHGALSLLPGIGLALLVASPYLYYDSQSGFGSVRALFGAVGGQAGWDFDALGYVVALASDLGLPVLTGELFRGEPIPRALPSLWPVAAALLVAGTALCLYYALRLWHGEPRERGRAVAYLFLVAACALPVLVWTRHSLPLYPHYFIVVYPVQFLAIGVAASALARAPSRLLRRSPAVIVSGYACVGLLVLALGASQLSYTVADLANTVYRGYREPADFSALYKPGIPLVYRQAALDGIRALRQRVGNAPVTAYAHQQELTLRYLGQPDVRVDCVEPPTMLMLPKDLSKGVILLLSSEQGSPDAVHYGVVEDTGPIVPIARRLGFAEDTAREIRGPQGDTYYRFFYLTPDQGKALAASFAKPPASPAMANGLRLAGVQVPPDVTPGQDAVVSLLWDLPADPMSENWTEYNVFAHLVDRAGKTVAQKDLELYQYRLLRQSPGMLVTPLAVPTSRDLGQGLLWFDVGLYERFSRQNVVWLGADGKPAGEAGKVGPVRVTTAGGVAPPAHRADVNFGGELNLDGYDLSVTGTALEARLHWSATAKPGGDYVVSVQLLDANGRLAAQNDSPPLGGDFPTPYWTQGERVVDAHAITLPAARQAGEYRVALVVYDAQSQKRLRVGDADSVSLTTIALPASP